MVCLPYPTFLHSRTVTPTSQSLHAVGRARIHPLTCPGKSSDGDGGGNGDGSPSSAMDEYQSIISLCLLQSQTDESTNEKLRKRYMKESVAKASSYLTQTLGLDVSIIDVDVVLNIDSILQTDGCLVSCFLDAGCAAVVVRVKQQEENDGNDNVEDDGLSKALEACDVARVPRERLILHCKDDMLPHVINRMEAVESRVGTVSLQLRGDTNAANSVVDTVSTTKADDMKWVFQIGTETTNSEGLMSKVSQSMGENSASITLVDPTPEQLGLCYASCLKSDRPDGLFTTVVCTRSNEALGLVYSSRESIIAALESGRGVYYSRSRSSLWRKGDSSGHYQTLHRIDVDCDSDALRFTVTQNGTDVKAFCHLNTLTCWGEPRGLRHLEETLTKRLVDAPAGSYTKRLFDDEQLLRDKLVEEAQELSEADTRQHVAEEFADLLYFAMVRAAKAGVSIDDAVAELDKRARKVTRRKGDSKAFRIKAGDEILGKKA
ncbi:hypothetical protein ACHAWU_005328 [Discostella pseudostelligera]|uniref:Phosphoribosyl-AMP cyclohydrolase domain-containing protein n=1 Tax=Discostella pseudostelligera TaxID=259834 RepID=A0ABD3N8L6_9STRA